MEAAELFLRSPTEFRWARLFSLLICDVGTKYFDNIQTLVIIFYRRRVQEYITRYAITDTSREHSPTPDQSLSDLSEEETEA